MPRPIDSAQISKLSVRRANLEMGLATSLTEVFNSGPVITRLREFVAQAIEQIVGFGEADPAKVTDPRQRDRVLQQVKGIDARLRGEPALRVWRGEAPTVLTLKKILFRWKQWTAPECSDLIRLYAAVTEDKGLRQLGFVGAGAASAQDGARVGAKEGHWTQPKDFKTPAEKAQAPRARIPADPKKGPAEAAAIGVPLPARTHARAARDAAVLQRLDPGGSAGLARFWMLGQSTLAKIDKVFGLPEGADISGTTADSIYFVRQVEEFFATLRRPDFQTFGGLTPAVQLLPLATMVSHAHHTLLETAIVLTMNGYGDYSVGFYSSLMPFTKSMDPAVAEVRRLLRQYDQLALDLHVLCFKEGGRWQGLQYTDPREVLGFQRLARADLRLLAHFRGFPYEPTRADLRQLAVARGVPALV